MLDPTLRSIGHSTGQACAKVILFGEHAVVHGTRAIAAGIRGGAEALAIADGRAELYLGGRLSRRTDGSAEATAFEELKRTLRDAAHAAAHSAQVTLHVPAGVGLGASAATAIAIARALATLLDPPPGEAQILEAALAWERVFHGNPSGVDTAAAASGGCISFRRGEPPRSIAERAPGQRAASAGAENERNGRARRPVRTGPTREIPRNSGSDRATRRRG